MPVRTRTIALQRPYRVQIGVRKTPPVLRGHTMSFLGRLAVVGALFCALAGPASAAPCWKSVVLDWAADGSVDRTYPIACYHQAITHLQRRSAALLERERRHPPRAPARDRVHERTASRGDRRRGRHGQGRLRAATARSSSAASRSCSSRRRRPRRGRMARARRSQGDRPPCTSGKPPARLCPAGPVSERSPSPAPDTRLRPGRLRNVRLRRSEEAPRWRP